MVGHTGNFKAAIRACEVVDECTAAVVKKALEKNYVTLIIADHGNCETTPILMEAQILLSTLKTLCLLF